jgi:hypothetical protein
MNNNLEFENEDPSPDSIEDNHPRTNYGEGYGGKIIDNRPKPCENKIVEIDGVKFKLVKA